MFGGLPRGSLQIATVSERAQEDERARLDALQRKKRRVVTSTQTEELEIRPCSKKFLSGLQPAGVHAPRKEKGAMLKPFAGGQMQPRWL